MGDLFRTLGYWDLRFNIHKSGREVDVTGTHRFEGRAFVAECKAYAVKKIGGDDLNKFAGVLQAERLRYGEGTHGYVVSLSGFKETAIEQELEFAEPRFTLIDGPTIVDSIVDGRIVVKPTVAAEAAGRAVGRAGLSLRREEDLELVGTQDGWLWVAYYQTSGVRTHVCVVHADGQVMSQRAVATLVGFDDLTFITDEGVHDRRSEHEAKTAYLDYVMRECGNITLDGLPVDQEVGTRSFRLESLYVPLGVTEMVMEDHLGASRSIGSVLSENQRIAVLGLPGSGKTTLVKWLATAYAGRVGRDAAPGDLPDGDLFPLVIRCRNLNQSTVRQPITSIIFGLLDRAERPDLADGFRSFIGDLLRGGRAIVLVDGLDEIADVADRSAFMTQLATFMSTYRSVRFVVTSRQFGFRAVAGIVESMCSSYCMAELPSGGIKELCRLWHREVFGDSAEIHAAADELADAILGSDRMRRLASNPLLLTTLLLVKRWVGQLPKKRSELYHRAIEVLLRTWNVEGYEPIDHDEVVPQLSYVAYQMMIAGTATITSAKLASFLADARTALPEWLSYTRLSVHELIRRVEERSSLLVLTGYREECGELQPVYEFRHLSFQEYLAAKAIAHGWLPMDLREAPPHKILSDYLDAGLWTEVTALSAVLSGVRAADIVRELVRLATEARTPYDRVARKPARNGVILRNIIACLEDEVPIAPQVVRQAIAAVVECDHSGDRRIQLARALRGGKYFHTLRSMVFEGDRDDSLRWYESYSDVAEKIAIDEGQALGVKGERAVERLRSDILGDDAAASMQAIILSARETWAFRRGISSVLAFAREDVALLTRVIARWYIQLGDASQTVMHSTMWALVGGFHVLDSPEDAELVNAVQLKAFDYWRQSFKDGYSYFNALMLTESPLVGFWEVSDKVTHVDFVRLLMSYRGPRETGVKRAALVAGFYLSEPFGVDEMRRMADELDCGLNGGFRARILAALEKEYG